MGLSNEVLCIGLPQGTAKLSEVKVGDTKKIQDSNLGPHSNSTDWAEQQFFFRPSTLTFGNFAVSLAIGVHSISYESPDTGANGFSLKKCLKALL